ncbi:hypothetical protein VNI00_013123 [Paramarasmius palmivorus]|uniref:FAD-binding PCMH-type domain-containing protein n=1 Tax=Paramarasmius palmivorus TaxID=297713 RepID=A0AAW0C197_9AGAR
MAPQNLMPKQLAAAIQEIQYICNASGLSSVHEYGSAQYKDSIRHFLASSSEVAQIAVHPGNVKDLCRIMKVISQYDVDFAIKGGGHGMAPTMSSTTGIHISMTRFSKIRYNQQTQLVEIGSGCLWDQVYSALAPTGRNVIGGASGDGVGVGGWLLGGGYSLKSNRYGLGIDNIVEFHIVTPDGRALIADANNEHKRLYQALRGGGNNFGIVTKFTLKTFAQNPTYGSYFLICGSRSEAFKDALVDFVENEQRQEACVVTAFRHELVRGKVDPEYNISIFCVFDAAKPKRSKDVPFQEFKKLQKKGDAWKVDPAGWQLGQTQLSITDGSLEHRAPSMPRNVSTGSSSRPTTPQALRNGTNRMRNVKRYPEPSRYSPKSRKSSRGDSYDNDNDDGSNSDAASIASSSGFFEEMAFSEFYQIKYFSPNDDGFDAQYEPLDSDDEGSEDEAGSGNEDDEGEDDEDEENEDYEDGDEDDEDDEDDSDNSGFNDSDDSDDGNWRGRKTGPRRGVPSSRRPAMANKAQPNYRWDHDRGAPVMHSPAPQRIMVTKKIDKMGELNERGRFGCVMVSTYEKELLDTMEMEAKHAASYLKKYRGLSVIIDAWPVHSSIFDNSPPGAAWPHERGNPFGPMLVYFRWEHEAHDQFWLELLDETLDRIKLKADELDLLPKNMVLYNNLSTEAVTAEEIYGENLKWLMETKAIYDPNDVMGRCGGHKIAAPPYETDSDGDW